MASAPLRVYPVELLDRAYASGAAEAAPAASRTADHNPSA